MFDLAIWIGVIATALGLVGVVFGLVMLIREEEGWFFVLLALVSLVLTAGPVSGLYVGVASVRREAVERGLATYAPDPGARFQWSQQPPGPATRPAEAAPPPATRPAAPFGWRAYPSPPPNLEISVDAPQTPDDPA